MAAQEALIYGEAIDSHPAGGEASGPSTAGAACTARPSAASLRYGLKIVDSLVHIGPIRDMSLGGLGACVCLPPGNVILSWVE